MIKLKVYILCNKKESNLLSTSRLIKKFVSTTKKKKSYKIFKSSKDNLIDIHH